MYNEYVLKGTVLLKKKNKKETTKETDQLKHFHHHG
jgi:hypothetical protein